MISVPVGISRHFRGAMPCSTVLVQPWTAFYSICLLLVSLFTHQLVDVNNVRVREHVEQSICLVDGTRGQQGAKS
ncbi:hypothetical protein JTE90_000430 [Oedothorax gibbosus]|uniref:Secreted protein n=1 Tax=Oedothorax gibbosus TaxID=931172 RepID=A0AAV6UGE3_9ARAC|nr:hypothetical protein JTE90_000430 [Oedothorax gibbosus]